MSLHTLGWLIFLISAPIVGLLIVCGAVDRVALYVFERYLNCVSSIHPFRKVKEYYENLKLPKK